MQIFNLLLPQEFPRYCKLHRDEMQALIQMMSEKIESTKFDPADTDGDHVFTSINMAIEYCIWVDKRYPLVCTSLELGSSWYEFVGRCLNLHRDDLSPDTQGTTLLSNTSVSKQLITTHI